jgi:hypothetical protein
MSTEPLENFEELGRRAVACKRWRWMPGMLSEKGLRVTRRDSDGYVVGYYEDLSYIAECVPGSLPDLSDPATLGCLLILVREAHNAPHAWVETRLGQRSRVVSPEGYSEGGKTLCDWQVGTEVVALVAALEKAP